MKEKKVSTADRVRETRALRRLTQAELAKRADIPVAAISHFETGLRHPSPENLKKLAAALAVSVDFLLGGEPTSKVEGARLQAVFRHAENLSDDALRELERFSEYLAKTDEQRKKRRGGKKT